MDQGIKDHIIRYYGLKEIEDGVFHGVFKGYEVNIFSLPGLSRYPLRAVISTHLNEEKADKLVQRVIDYKKGYNHFSAEVPSLSIISKARSYNAFIHFFDPAFLASIEALKSENCPDSSFCPFTGELLYSHNSREVKIGKMTMRLSEDGIEEYKKEVSAYEKEVDALPYRPILGYLGAIIGAIIGFFLQYMLLNFLDFGPIGPFASMMVGFFLGTRLSKKPSWSLFPLLIILSFFASAAAILLYYFSYAISAFPDKGNAEAIAAAFSYPSFVFSFVLEIFTSLLALGGGVALNIVLLKKMKQKPFKIEDENQNL